MLTNATILGRAFSGDPMLLQPERAEWAAHALLDAADAIQADGRATSMAVSEDFWAFGDDDPWRPYVVRDGVLLVPVSGVLLNKFPYQLGGWATGYEYIEQAVQRGLDDPGVRGIALMVDSPGGLVAGCFECADALYAARSQKPVRAFVDTAAFSGAYALASAASEISLTRSGGTGSVGVIMAHVDASGFYDRMGLKVTLIYSGKHKADGNPHEALPEDVRARFQARVDKIRGVFVSTVARNRNMSEDAVYGTEAMTYDAEESVDIGFADNIESTETALAQFAQALDMEKRHMPANENSIAISFTEADVAAARAEGHASGRAEGIAEGASAEKTRIIAILNSEEAKVRPFAAMAAALETDMPADKATAFLSKLPAEAKASVGEPKSAGGFNAAMDATQNPNVGANVDAGGEDDDEESRVMSLINVGRRAVGLKPVN
jgi:signal peptide peptidase SppA